MRGGGKKRANRQRGSMSIDYPVDRIDRADPVGETQKKGKSLKGGMGEKKKKKKRKEQKVAKVSTRKLSSLILFFTEQPTVCRCRGGQEEIVKVPIVQNLNRSHRAGPRMRGCLEELKRRRHPPPPLRAPISHPLSSPSTVGNTFLYSINELRHVTR